MVRASESISTYAAFFRAGYVAVKFIDTSIQVMIHLSNGFDRPLDSILLAPPAIFSVEVKMDCDVDTELTNTSSQKKKKTFSYNKLRGL